MDAISSQFKFKKGTTDLLKFVVVQEFSKLQDSRELLFFVERRRKHLLNETVSYLISSGVAYAALKELIENYDVPNSRFLNHTLDCEVEDAYYAAIDFRMQMLEQCPAMELPSIRTFMWLNL